MRLRFRWVASGCREEASAGRGYAFGGGTCGENSDAKLFEWGVRLLASLPNSIASEALHAHSQVYWRTDRRSCDELTWLGRWEEVLA